MRGPTATAKALTSPFCWRLLSFSPCNSGNGHGTELALLSSRVLIDNASSSFEARTTAKDRGSRRRHQRLADMVRTFRRVPPGRATRFMLSARLDRVPALLTSSVYLVFENRAPRPTPGAVPPPTPLCRSSVTMACRSAGRAQGTSTLSTAHLGPTGWYWPRRREQNVVTRLLTLNEAGAG